MIVREIEGKEQTEPKKYELVDLIDAITDKGESVKVEHKERHVSMACVDGNILSSQNSVDYWNEVKTKIEALEEGDT